MEVAAQLSLHFPGAKCHLEKQKKRHYISGTIQPISLSFHQNDRTVSDYLILVTDYLANEGQGQH